MLKSIKNIFLAMSITLLAAGSASASLISHEILFDDLGTTDVVFEKIGYFQVETSTADDWGTITSWKEFKIDILGSSFKFFTEADAINVGNMSLFDHFEVIINPNDIFAGVAAISFLVTENTSSAIEFQGIFGFGSSNTLDLFNTVTGNLEAAGNIKLSSVTVPEPSMLLLFLTGLIALRLKRAKA